MSISVPKFVHNVQVKPLQRNVQWYEFEPANSDGFFELLLILGRKPIKRIDVFRRSELIQSTSPSDAPEFDLQIWDNMNKSGNRVPMRSALENLDLERFFVHRGDIIYVRIEAELPAAFRFTLNRCTMVSLDQDTNLLVNVGLSTRIIVDQGQQPCNFSIDFGKILDTDFTLFENNMILVDMPITSDAKVHWAYEPNRDNRIRILELSALIPYETNINIVRNDG